MVTIFKPALLPPKAVKILTKEASQRFREMTLVGRRIAKTLGARKAMPVSLRTFTTSIGHLRKEGIKLLLDFGIQKDAAKYIMFVVNTRAAKASPTKNTKPIRSRRVLPFEIPNGPFTMRCAAFSDATCGCEISWKGGGMSCSCF